MQLSWPEVGHGGVDGKVDTGNLLKHPWKRARTTFQYLAVAILGRPDDRAAFREAVNSSHRHVKSTANSPVRYDAFDRELQMWVAACLFVGLEDTYQLLRGRMTVEQAEQFYKSAWTLGTTLQVTEDQWPPTRADFDAYWVDACRRVAIDEQVRAYLQDLLNLRMINPVLALPFRPLLKFLTVGFLAPVFRDAMGCSGAVSNSASSRRCSYWSPSSTASCRCSSARAAATCCWPTCAGGSAITERWCRAVLRRVLSRRASVEAMIEFALWMAIPYIVIGLVFAFFGAEQVQLIETQLQTRLPAGSDIAAFVLTVLLWPAMLLGVDVCVA
jgi:hypothetical protein